eukprot:GHVL01011261.1.p1 GENE.GHVL01011261.1~~GHVL01011261.1.p1  ORF type:complete len:644 (+),score=125.82 GHVL01011261.1:126-2057(+)
MPKNDVQWKHRYNAYHCECQSTQGDDLLGYRLLCAKPMVSKIKKAEGTYQVFIGPDSEAVGGSTKQAGGGFLGWPWELLLILFILFAVIALILVLLSWWYYRRKYLRCLRYIKTLHHDVMDLAETSADADKLKERFVGLEDLYKHAGDPEAQMIAREASLKEAILKLEAEIAELKERNSDHFGELQQLQDALEMLRNRSVRKEQRARVETEVIREQTVIGPDGKVVRKQTKTIEEATGDEARNIIKQRDENREKGDDDDPDQVQGHADLAGQYYADDEIHSSLLEREPSYGEDEIHPSLRDPPKTEESDEDDKPFNIEDYKYEPTESDLADMPQESDHDNEYSTHTYKETVQTYHETIAAHSRESSKDGRESHRSGEVAYDAPLSQRSGRASNDAPLSQRSGRASYDAPLSQRSGRASNDAPLSQRSGRASYEEAPLSYRSEQTYEEGYVSQQSERPVYDVPLSHRTDHGGGDEMDAAEGELYDTQERRYSIPESQHSGGYSARSERIVTETSYKTTVQSYHETIPAHSREGSEDADYKDQDTYEEEDVEVGTPVSQVGRHYRDDHDAPDSQRSDDPALSEHSDGHMYGGDPALSEHSDGHVYGEDNAMSDSHLAQMLSQRLSDRYVPAFSDGEEEEQRTDES